MQSVQTVQSMQSMQSAITNNQQATPASEHSETARSGKSGFNNALILAENGDFSTSRRHNCSISNQQCIWTSRATVWSLD